MALKRNVLKLQSEEELLKLRNLYTEEISTHDTAYYINHDPLISDQEYDVMLADLAIIESLVDKAPDSPTTTPGKDTTPGFQRRPHKYKMLSLDNSYSADTVFKEMVRMERVADEELEFVAEPKIDGISVSLTYDKGVLVQALSRGDGTLGDDITEQVKRTDVPETIEYKGHFECRGEIYLTKKDFERINILQAKRGLKLYKNPRNLCSGTIKSLDLDEVKRRGPKVLVFELVNLPSVDTKIDYHHEALAWLSCQGFNTVEVLGRGDKDSVSILVDLYSNNDAVIPTDGMVILVNKLMYRNMLGASSKAPKWAFAYKCAAESKCTEVIGYIYQVGKTGRITPVILLAPVELSGTTVARCTLHNDMRVRQLDIHVGDFVNIHKGGEIIPHITGVDLSKRPDTIKAIIPPMYCPECDTECVVTPKSRICPNTDCFARCREQLKHFVGRSRMDITGLGEETIRDLMESGLVKHPLDIYSLTVHDMLGKTNMSEKEIGKLIPVIEQSRAMDASVVLASMGIPGVGMRAATELLNALGSIEDVSKATVEELDAIPKVNKDKVFAIRRYFEDKRNLESIQVMKKIGLNTTAVDTREDKPSRRFVATGVIPGISKRDLGLLLKHHGCVLESRVNSDTDILLVGDKGTTTGKYKKAMSLGTPIKMVEQTDEVEDIIVKSLK